MIGFAKTYVMANEDAENIVQDLFFILWDKNDDIDVTVTLTTFLFTLVKNKCLNFLRHKLVEEEYHSYMAEELRFKLQALEHLHYSYPTESDLQKKIDSAIDTLSPRCKEIFIKSRFEGKKYKEIAEELQISSNTVENQMTNALRKLRHELKDFLPLFLFLIH